MENKKSKFTKEKLTAAFFVAGVFALLISMAVQGGWLRDSLMASYQSAREAQVAAAPEKEASTVAKLEAFVSSVDGVLNENVRNKDQFLEIHSFLQKAMGKQMVNDLNYGALYKTGEGQVTFTVAEKEVEPAFEKLLAMKQELDQEGIPLLYVQAPFRVTDGTQLPDSIVDFSNANADRFLKKLSENGINYLDLRPALQASGMSQKELFFNTDHHWTIQGAFYGMGEIVGRLNAAYGFSIEDRITDLSYYNQKTYEDFFIGSLGRRVGKAYGGTDDFTLITPKFDTDYTLTEFDYGKKKEFEGSFEEAILSNKYMDPDAPLTANRYAVYHGDMSELIFENHEVEDGKILIVKDSFAVPVYSFLSLGVHELRALDMRSYTGAPVSEYAKTNRPDVVIVMYNCDTFTKELFNFSGVPSSGSWE